ncbi:MAG: hypothetical protein JRC77_08815 [Deltaproteobacteria bacterium]|nr:hypothetical protein [Deltaproteobacteria bacterium]
MKSHEVLKEVIETVGTKQVAYDLRVSTSLVYKWCAEPPADLGEDGSGARNPLDRIVNLIESTGNPRLVEWLCLQHGGYFVENMELEEPIGEAYISHTRTLLAEFSELLQVMSDSIASEGRIDAKEALEIRRQWHRLQGRGEGFVRACETGVFDPDRQE